VYIVHQDVYTVHADGITIASCNALPVALALYCVAHYVFNFHFPKNSAKTLVFLQKYAFNIIEKSRDPFYLRCQRACTVLMEKITMKSAKSSLPSHVQPPINLEGGQEVPQQVCGRSRPKGKRVVPSSSKRTSRNKCKKTSPEFVFF